MATSMDSRGDITEGVAIDPEDAEVLSQHNWYATATQDKKMISLHRTVMERAIGRPLEKGEIVDHINGNGLDNRRCNLRIVTHSQNMHNRKPNRNHQQSSSYKGVCWLKQNNKWRAGIEVNGHFKQLGVFDNETEAAICRDKEALRLQGEYAYLNFPELRDSE